jgi:hypothetical protein
MSLGTGFMALLRTNIISGAQALGWSAEDLDLNVANSPINTVLNQTFAHNGDDGSGASVYDRIRCNSYHSAAKNKDISRCEYVIPVKRVVTTPDQLEFVFLDQDREYANPAMAVFLAASFYDSVSDANGHSDHPGAGFCQRTGPCAPSVTPVPDSGITGNAAPLHVGPLLLTPGERYLTRSYSTVAVGPTTYGHNGDFCGIPGSCDALALGLSFNGLGFALGIDWLFLAF